MLYVNYLILDCITKNEIEYFGVSLQVLNFKNNDSLY